MQTTLTSLSSTIAQTFADIIGRVENTINELFQRTLPAHRFEKGATASDALRQTLNGNHDSKATCGDTLRDTQTRGTFPKSSFTRTWPGSSQISQTFTYGDTAHKPPVTLKDAIPPPSLTAAALSAPPNTPPAPIQAIEAESWSFHPDFPLIRGGYEVLSVLGKGGFGTVYKARAPDGTLVAVKCFSSPASLYGIKHEFKMAQLGGPVVPAIEMTETSAGERAIVLEYMPGGTLKSHILKLHELRKACEGMKTHTNVLLEIQKRLRMALLQTADGFRFLHENGIIHYDVKSDNLILDAEGNLRILDMGTAHHVGEHKGLVIRSRGYTPPEVGVLRDIEGNYSHRAMRFLDKNGNALSVPVPEIADKFVLEAQAGLPSILEDFEDTLAPLFEARNPNALNSLIPPTERTDVYSIGMLLGEILMGMEAVNEPFTLSWTASPSIMRDHCRLWGLSPKVADVITRATEPNPQDRFASAVELLEALRAALLGVTTTQASKEVVDRFLCVPKRLGDYLTPADPDVRGTPPVLPGSNPGPTLAPVSNRVPPAHQATPRVGVRNGGRQYRFFGPPEERPFDRGYS